jgi:hypothetical protein
MITKIKTEAFGIFEKSSQGNEIETDPESPTGYYVRTDDIILIEKTLTIPAELGIVFGVKYIPVSSEPDETIIRFKSIIHHPVLNPPDGESFSITTEQKWCYGNQSNFDFYEFEQAWEIQKGTWTFQIVDGDKILYEQEFTIK